MCEDRRPNDRLDQSWIIGKPPPVLCLYLLIPSSLPISYLLFPQHRHLSLLTVPRSLTLTLTFTPPPPAPPRPMCRLAPPRRCRIQCSL